MFHKLQAVETRFLEIENRLADPDIANKPGEFKKLSLEHAHLQEIVAEFRKHKTLNLRYQECLALRGESDKEIAQLAELEIASLEPELQSSERALQILLLPKDPNDRKNIVLEIRAGTGGDEAALFVADLFRMYQRYSERRGWRVDILSVSPTGIGGLKEIFASIEGDKVYSRLKLEGGVHRVQRVPDTETQGRIHTSTVTVAVLPQAEEVEVDINPADLRVDVFRSGGAGGQGVNTTDSAVRLTHIPSGLVVVCQDERSQLKNKDKAMKILRARLLDLEQEKAQKAESEARRSMVGTGDRSERIRTYNFPQGRLTDHRIGLTLYKLGEIMQGDLNELLDQIQTFYQLEELKKQGMGTS